LLGFLVETVDLNASFYASALLVFGVGAYILKWKPELLPGRRETAKATQLDGKESS